MRTIVFVDGQNLFHRSKRLWGGPKSSQCWTFRYPGYDVARLANALTIRTPERILVEARFYTGVPIQGSKGAHGSWRNFWTRKLNLMRSSGIQVYEGRARPGGQEKGVDVSIAIDLLHATYEERYDVAIIVSSDSDFEPAVELARKIAKSQSRRIQIESAYPSSMIPGKQYGIPGTDWKPFDRDLYEPCLDVPKLYTYVVRDDSGFAPNPYHGFCTLACCKPLIRKSAQVGDWIVGIGSASKGRANRIVYAMQVIETHSFASYWDDPRFAYKKPRMDAGYVESVGDNAYHVDEETGEWIQEPCQHCESDCTPTGDDMDADLSVNRVLIGETYTYWGGDGPELPLFAGEQLFAGRGHKFRYKPEVMSEFLRWYDELGLQGVVGEPADKAMARRAGMQSCVQVRP